MNVLVTGGGRSSPARHLVELLAGNGHDVFAARRHDYDLTSIDDTARLFSDARPEVVYHLAAEVGGIGATARTRVATGTPGPGPDGHSVLEQSLIHDVRSSRSPDRPLLSLKHTPVPFNEDELWSRFQKRRTPRTESRRSRCSSAARPTANSIGL